MIDTSELEQIIIECLIENIEMSGAVAPAINAQTAPLSDISGFDSLRTLELLTELEVRLDCQIPSSVFLSEPHPQDLNVSHMSKLLVEHMAE